MRLHATKCTEPWFTRIVKPFGYSNQMGNSPFVDGYFVSLFTAGNYFASSARNFAAISLNASGTTPVFASTGMKFVSPFQRGTT